MKIGKVLEQLSESMSAWDWHDVRDPNPFILLLGAGCARAAGVPAPAMVARQALEGLYKRDPETAAKYVPDMDQAQDSQMVRALLQFLGSMPGLQRRSVLNRLYGQLSVPLFYQELATLVQAGFFSRIATTNMDLLLDQALEHVGLWPGTGYQVISLGEVFGLDSTNFAARGTECPIKIVRVYADPTSSEPTIMEEALEDALEPERATTKEGRTGGVLVVGYEFECEAINQLLPRLPGELWWVSEEFPGRGVETGARSRTVMITGDSARPDAFFSQLGLQLLRRPVVEAMTKSIDDDYPEEIAEVGEPEQRDEIDSALPAEETIEVDLLQDQSRRQEAMLYDLEQKLVVGEESPGLKAQIKYQRDKMFEVEDELRELRYSGPMVISLMNEITRSAKRADADAGAVSFLRKQVNTVKAEYNRDLPNQEVVSAAIGGMVLLAGRLSKDAVDPQLLRELGSIAPSSVGRRVK